MKWPIRAAQQVTSQLCPGKDPALDPKSTLTACPFYKRANMNTFWGQSVLSGILPTNCCI